MNNFVSAVNEVVDRKNTLNGGNAYKSTGNALVDFFGSIGAMRTTQPEEIIRKFEAAFAEDKVLAMKTVFYARNIRGGLGERNTFKVLINYIAGKYPSIMFENLMNIPEFGRWDDMYSLVGTDLGDVMWSYMQAQLFIDINNMMDKKPISLLAKWLKSINTSSKESQILGKLTAKNFGLTERDYRITLSILRDYINVVESHMSNGEWNQIDFEKVPSKAMMNYRNAFAKRAPDRFAAFIADVQSGEKKINSAAVYPYEIVERMHLNYDYYYENDYASFEVNYDPILEEQWRALPNYVEKASNFLVMADTSGSMTGRPMATSLSLAIYFAERNTGAFKDLFMTFSSEPRFVKLQGNTLAEKVNCIESIVDHTNLEYAFDEVLNVAIRHKIPVEDMPKAIIVISDMEIDRFQYDNRAWSFLEVMEHKFNSFGYELPKVVMWNVSSLRTTFLERYTNPKVQFISGSSPSVFKSLINSIDKSAYQLMMDTLSDPIYDVVVA